MSTTIAKWILVAAAMVSGQVAVGQEVAAQAPREMSSFQLQPPRLDATAAVDSSVTAGAVDLGLRALEGGAEAGLFLVGLADGLSFSGQPANAGLATAALVADAVVLLAGPALNAIVGSHVGPGYHPFVPLLVTSYVTNFAVDALTLGLLGTSWGAPIAYAVGSLLGASSMGLVHGLTAHLAETATGVELPVTPRGPQIPTATAQGATLRF